MQTPGGPASRNPHIHTGLELVAINGVLVTGQPLSLCYQALWGAKGSAVVISTREALGPDDEELEETTLVRAPVIGEEFEDHKIEQMELAGVGLKIHTNVVTGQHIVRALVRHSPAETSGLIKHGDEIILVDDTEVAGKGIDEVGKALLGPEGTVVHLVLRRAGRIHVKLALTRQYSKHQSDRMEILHHAQHAAAMSASIKGHTSSALESSNDMSKPGQASLHRGWVRSSDAAAEASMRANRAR